MVKKLFTECNCNMQIKLIVEKVIKGKCDKLCVKWKDYDNSYTRFFIRKPFFCLSLNFLNIMLEIRLRFS